MLKMSDLKIFAKTIDEKAREQIDLLLAQDAFKDCKIRIMPDVHAGIGCVIGFTAYLGDKVIPNIVGVDIGCGMLTVELGKISIDFDKLDAVIRENIPYGMNVNDVPVKCGFIEELEDLVCWNGIKNKDRIKRSLCSLGGGNHFIEVDADDDGNKYLVIHTGSRNLGKQVAEIYQNFAISRMCGKEKFKKICDNVIAKLKEIGKEKQIEKTLKTLNNLYNPEMSVPKELCYLERGSSSTYLHDMGLCQRFADWNRTYIARRICEKIGWSEDNQFQTIHNYIESGSNIVRKGAISAKNGERVLIPINMRDGCILGVGLGNKDWNESAPHGAGRILSRAEAKLSISLSEYKNTMSGIFTTSVSEDTIDEAPQAYKPMQEIVDCISDTVKIEKIIKPVYNFKASE